MNDGDQANILMVDDQPGKLMSYEVILKELNENLIQARSAREALDQLLRQDIAVVLMDVSMPEIDGFELADMMRQHPRFQKTAIIFISAVHLTDLDRIRGYKSGAVDYISVPVIPELLRAKVSVFAELHRKNRQLERLNRELEERVRSGPSSCMRANTNSAPWRTPSRSSLGWPMPMVPSSGTTSDGTTSSAPCPERCRCGDGGMSSIQIMRTASLDGWRIPEGRRAMGRHLSSTE